MTPWTRGWEARLRVPRPAALAAVAAALLFAAGSCRLSPTSPAHDPTVGGWGDPTAALAPGGGHAPPPWPTGEDRVPVITHLSGTVVNGTLHLTGNLQAAGPRSEMEYSPYEPGGWCLQVLVNTDQRRTGYWLGYEYVVRGVEWDAATRLAVVRRITLDDAYPGGWGPSSGEATLRVSRGSFALAVPLAAIGDDDGDLDFVLEVFLTVACPECTDGYAQTYGAHYFGVVSSRAPAAPARGPVVLTDRAARWGLRPLADATAAGR